MAGLRLWPVVVCGRPRRQRSTRPRSAAPEPQHWQTEPIPQPPAVDAFGDPLIRTIAEAWQAVTAEIDAIAADPRKFRRAAQLRGIQRRLLALMDDVDAETRVWLSQQYPRIYALGAADLAIAEPFTWSGPHRSAIAALANSTFDDILKSTRHVRRTTKLLIRELVRSETLSVLAGGRTAVQGGRTLARLLEDHKIHAVVYKDGSRHGLQEYGEMVIRTRSATAYNAGALNHGSLGGVTFYEVLDGFGCGWTSHTDPDVANGSIRSAEECAKQVLSHPRCRRSFGPRPDIRDAKVARSAQPSTTPEERADQANAEQARAAGFAKRADRRAALQRRQQLLARRQARLRR